MRRIRSFKSDSWVEECCFSAELTWEVAQFVPGVTGFFETCSLVISSYLGIKTLFSTDM